MKKVFLIAVISLSALVSAYSQCTTTNATSCQCLDGSSDCDLLPNIILAEEPLLVVGSNGIIEYSQTGNGAENGRLRVSVSTPNIGRGPLTVVSSQTFICGADTFTTNPGTCPGGGSPRQLIWQRVYHKSGNTMTSWMRHAGSMTYHPTHQHMHVDDWGTYDLRIRDTAQSNPLLWPIVGTGAKLGFCLMDYGTCSYYNGHCEDSAGNVMLNGDFPNYGLGGGNYNCAPTVQGISSGYTDIYYQHLDGMYINIPPNTCNGDYYIVVHIDPHNYFLEEKETDNVIAMPFTLTKQVPAGTGSATISLGNSGSTSFCEGSSITLTANSGSSYLWSTNDTTQSITVNESGAYTVQVASLCGVASSTPVQINKISSHINNKADAAVCIGNQVVLNADATGNILWFTSDTATSIMHTGNTYSFTPSTTTTLYIQSSDTVLGISGSVGPATNTIGAGSFYSNDQHQIFDVAKSAVLKTVKVYAGSTKNRTIELRNSSGVVLQTKTVNISSGEQVVSLDFPLTPGTGFQLGWLDNSSPDFYRNSSGASYPYTLAGLVTVTGNSANDLVRWYAYYDWQVEETPIICNSPKEPIVATVNPNPTVSMSGLNVQYFDTDTNVTLIGSPAGGTFSGTGVSGNVFSPSTAGIGGPYTVTYNYTDSATGCGGAAIFDVSVILDPTSGLPSIEGVSAVNVFPNPGNGLFELAMKSTTAKKINLEITNAQGQRVFEEKNMAVNGFFRKFVDIRGTAAGIYTLSLLSGKESVSYQLIIK